MIDKKFIYENVLPLIEEKSRMLEYYMIQSLFENKDKEIISELKKYQNEDLGFGNCLEPDVRMPNSSVVATDYAVHVLDYIHDESLKEDLIKDIVTFYENSYDEEKERFLMVTKEVDDYPRAIWWNFDDLEKNFPFGNPDPEVIGFLFKNRKYIKNLNYSKLINKVVDYVNSDKFLEAGMHTLMSVLSFYDDIQEDVQNLIHDRLHLLVNKELDAGVDKWDEYSLEPYKIYIIEPHFLNTRLQLLGENLTRCIGLIKELSVEPNWQWYQFEKEFENAKNDWIGVIYLNMIKALKIHRIL